MKNYKPRRSASRSRIKSISALVSSPSLRSNFTLATVAMRCTSNAPSLLRNGLRIGTSQRLSRTAVVWATTVKTSKSSPRGCEVRMRHGRTFAAMPKSTIQMSPGFAAGIFGFLFVHVAEHRVGGLVEELRLVPLVQFAQTAADGGTLVVRQLGQFGKDFNRTHGMKLTLTHRTGKWGF